MDDPDLQPYSRRRDELSGEGGYVLWGNRVIIPARGRVRALQMLHETHPGIVQTKSLARRYMWWPGMDADIESCVKQCTECQSSRKMPPVVLLHLWARPDRPWSRVHIDYAGPFEGTMFFLLIDAHSKWLEVHQTNTSTSTVTIELMRKSFSALGIPETIVSDNAANFTSDEFATFLKQNGIRHVRSAPYHPASNCVVEQAVQTFKEGMKRLKSGSLNTRLARFLLRYRITPHTSTGTSPSELMWGRTLRSPLDLLLPDPSQKVEQAQDRQRKSHDAHSSAREFNVSDVVYARNYSSGPHWLPGQVVELQGKAMCKVQLGDNRTIVRHFDQLRPRANTEPIVGTSNSSDTSEGPLVESDTSRPTLARDDGGEPSETENAGTTTRESSPAVEPPQRVEESPAVPESTVRRSSRARQPPQRYEEENFDW